MHHALTLALASRGVKLYHFADLSQLSWQLEQWSPQFVLLDDSIIPGEAEKDLLQRSHCSLFCLGKNLGWGHWVPKPFNPQTVAHIICSQ